MNLTHSLEHVANVCFCDKLLLMEFLLTSGWCPAKVKLWVPRDWIACKTISTKREKQRRNRPGYYKHNHAYYRATLILVLSCSKAYIPLIEAPQCVSFLSHCTSLIKLLLSEALSFLLHHVQITTCSGGWPGDPSCKTPRPVPASGFMMAREVHG